METKMVGNEKVEGVSKETEDMFEKITIDNYRKNYDWFLNQDLEFSDPHFVSSTFEGKVYHVKFLRYLGQAEVEKYFMRDQLGTEKKHVYVVDVYGTKRIMEIDSKNWEAISKKYPNPEDIVGKVLKFRNSSIELVTTNKFGEKIEHDDPYVEYVPDEELNSKGIIYLSPRDFPAGDKMIVKVESIGKRDDYNRIHLIVDMYGDKYDLPLNEKVEKELKNKVGDLKNLVGKNLKLEVIKIYDYKSFTASLE